MSKRRKKQQQWTPVYDIYGNFRCLAWRPHSHYTSYLFYVESQGYC
jgi:hypothetical protein